MIERPYTAFWGEMSAFEHFVQVYEKESAFLDTLSSFVHDGLVKGEGVIAIVTLAHQHELERRLTAQNLDLSFYIDNEQLVLLDAQETIGKFMVNDWPDEEKFQTVVTDTLRRAGAKGRKVRAFGEMVALMWAQGQCAATVRLEHLWTELCRRENLPLFCAYPKSGFTQDPQDSMAHLCSLHSKTVGE
ncbi:MAG TPA: MEDS domain-containing protein [Patescibacteria group bacterium]|nr:MEDS domain-containing protein [Patescibacteria group bacterium]